MVGLAAYSTGKYASGKESSPLELWARRSCFGKGGETPAVRWLRNEEADIAYLALNTAVLGMTASLVFRVHSTHMNIPPKIGMFTTVERTENLEFSIVLPQFDEHRSGYRWSLIVHRHGDKNTNGSIGGQRISHGEFQAPLSALGLATSFAQYETEAPVFTDYILDSAVPLESIRQIKDVAGNRVSQLKVVSGKIELISGLSKHNILSATLTVHYWPERHTPSAYAMIEVYKENT